MVDSIRIGRLLFNTKEERFLKETHQLFSSDEGVRVLEYLRRVLHVEDTLEPEEQLNRDLEAANRHERVQIDPIGFAKRQGMKSAYYKIEALIKQGGRMVKEKDNE